MRRRRAILILLLAALPVLACSSGDECDSCDSDDDCQGGLVCARFNDGSMHCASGLGATQCR
jgi:hypothetical protein